MPIRLFFCEYASEAERKIATVVRFGALMNRSYCRAFGTSAASCPEKLDRSSCSNSRGVSSMCGMTFGLTNDPTSMYGSRARISVRTSSSRISNGMRIDRLIACIPSRGDISQIVTWSGIERNRQSNGRTRINTNEHESTRIQYPCSCPHS